MCRKFVVCLFLAAPLLASPEKTHQVYNFTKGVDTYHSSLSLPDGYVQNSLNVLFDDKGPVSKRKGFTTVFSSNAYSGQQLWSYTDPTNTSWIIVRDSDEIIANNLTSSTSVLISTVSSNNVVGFTTSQGNAYFVDQTQGVYYWNGTATTYVASSPNGSLMAQWHQRVWISGAAVPNGNQLYGSKLGDGTVWTVGPNPNDPVQLTVGLQDNFDNITALYPFLDTLYIFKHFLTYAEYGFDQTNFQTSFITQECGCIDQNSIQTYLGGLKFVSERGLENFNGYTCTRIGDCLKDKYDQSILAQGGFSLQSWVQQSQADWQAGTITPPGNLSTTALVPSLVLSTQAAFSGTDNSQANWQAGTLSNLDATTNSPNLQLSKTYGSSFIDQSFTSQTSFNRICNSGCCSGCLCFNDLAQAFTTSSSNPQQITSVEIYCTQDFGSPTYTVDIKSDSSGSPGTTLVSGTLTGSNCGSPGNYNWVSVSISPTNLSASTQYWIYIEADSNVGQSNDIAWGEGPGSVSIPSFRQACSPQVQSNYAYDFKEHIQIQNAYTTTGAITSRVFDVGTTTNSYLFNWGTFNTTETDNGQTIVYETQVASSSFGSWDSPVTVNPGGVIGSATREFIQYIASFTTTNSQQTPVLSTVTMNTSVLERSSGTIKSQIHNFGTINSFGNFSVSDILNNGNILFSICISTKSDLTYDTCSQNQTPNAQISLSTGTGGTGTYEQWYASFTVTNATQTPTLQSVTSQAFAGKKASPISSTVWDNRYWVSLTTNTSDSGNDAVLIYGPTGACGVFDIHAGGFTQSKNSLYHSDSRGTGLVYLDNQAYADNGNPIIAFIQTKDYCEEGPAKDDYYESLYPSMDNLGNYNMTIGYNIDRSTPTFSLSSINQTEFYGNTSIKIPFVQNATNQNFGKCINYTFTESDANSPWIFYGFTDSYHERQLQ